jgi:hypothetical protein
MPHMRATLRAVAHEIIGPGWSRTAVPKNVGHPMIPSHGARNRVSIAKKLVEPSTDKKVIRTHAEWIQSRQLRAMLRTPWPWPRAVMAILLISLLLWGGVLAIASLAFN